ncbi:hypothetical protein K456DRAFT_1742962, partial [Colletotrichum gloeosporioides 23]
MSNNGTSGFGRHGLARHNVHKRKPDERRFAETGGHDHHDYTSSKSKRVRLQPPQPPRPPFACHFWKRDAQRFCECSEKSFSELHRLKDHLNWTHNPIYCRRCGEVFTSEGELNWHLTLPKPCTLTEVRGIIGMNDEQYKAIRNADRRYKGRTAEQSWFLIWDILFPFEQRPTSAFWENSLPDFMSEPVGCRGNRNTGPPDALDYPTGLQEEIGNISEQIYGNDQNFKFSGLDRSVSIEDLIPGPRPNSIIRRSGNGLRSSCDLAQDERLEQQHFFNDQYQLQYTNRKLFAPFTDSGYASTSKLIAIQYPHSSQRSSQRDAASTKDAIIDDKIRTTCTLYNNLEVSHEQQYISEACQSIRDNLVYDAGPENWTLLSQRLPELFKAFAFKIGLESADQANLRVMWFFHNYGEKIATQLLCDESETEKTRDNGESMSLEDKLKLWWGEARCSTGPIDEYRCRDVKDLSSGEDDEDLGNIEASSHNKTVLESGAFRWLVRSLRNEMALQEDYDSIRGHDSRVDIRKKILRQLPTGKISKSRPPTIHKVMVRLCKWPMITHNKSGRSDTDHSDTRTFDSMIVVCCGGNLQMLSIKQYMKQTWPSTWYQVMSLLEDASNDTGAFVVNLPDKTQLVCSTEHNDLVLGISGPAHTIAECTEQLAWVLAALRFPHDRYDTVSQHLPIISDPHKVSNDSMHRLLQFMQAPPRDRHFLCFDIHVRAFDGALVQANKVDLFLSFSDGIVAVPGYPMLRRPAGVHGIEFSAEQALQLSNDLAEAAEKSDGESQCTLTFVQQHKGLYIWHANRMSQQLCHCRPGDDRDKDNTWPFRDLKRFFSGRHFISQCKNQGQIDTSPWKVESMFNAFQCFSSTEQDCFTYEM